MMIAAFCHHHVIIIARLQKNIFLNSFSFFLQLGDVDQRPA
jgi:hypothetical protein